MLGQNIRIPTIKAPTRVGIVGLSAKGPYFVPGAWATLTILPSIQNSHEYEIVALCNSSVEAARRSIAKNGLHSSTKAYEDIRKLAGDAGVDLVVVSVGVPKHLELAVPALAAKKKVYIEWPLGASVAEAERLAGLAEADGLQTIVVFQGRSDSLTVQLREMVESGEIGDLLILDFCTHVLGDFDLGTLSSVLKIDLAQGPLHNTDGKVVDPAYPKSAPDHVLVQGKLNGGATASLNFRTTSGTVGNVGGRWIISGTKGEIEVSWDNMMMWQTPHPSKTLKVKLFTGEERDVELTRPDIPAVANVSDLALSTALILDAFAKGNGQEQRDN
ncbi:Galactose/lactose metabolism regulatory protein GAL80 [Colletotrichum tanaceti]|uniref:Galactose/lactose metabolism regulatory protein GAL80 n=1 Tax=Colletotrichum tanaceti TaxID=1306861 RepID=A0A4U6XLP5_9PEZI|nr:Galactose/lactose metabolism regulatory protein GAL80 [Colletotrichum tanaceti]